MQVIQAKTAGFCYGVERAVRLAEETAREKGGCVMLGSIIHNAIVVSRLEELGARQVEDPSLISSADTVLIRAHGEKKQTVELLRSKGVACVDATCPNVLRLQQLVAQADREGRIPLIIGEPHHPEVMGVASWSERSVVLSGPADVERWLAEDPSRCRLPLTAVAQTTCIRSIWESSAEFLKKQCTNAELFDTICNATHRRQTEAAQLAEQVDVMVVVGDRKSANTKHLTEICSERCSRVVQIERAEELSPDFLIGCSVAGLTAGASTPAGIIKEVCTTMSEEIKSTEAQESFEEVKAEAAQVEETAAQAVEEVKAEAEAAQETVVETAQEVCAEAEAAQETVAEATEEVKAEAEAVQETAAEAPKSAEAKEESFEEMLEKSFKTLNTGEKVTGIVTAINSTEIQVDLGCKQAGYIKVEELSSDPNVKPEDVVKVGDEIETYVIRVNDVEGYAQLSKKRLDAVKVWEDIEKAREEKVTLEGKVTEENKGGIVVNVKGVRVFVPASQSGQPRGADLSEMVGQTVSLRITEVNRARRRVVGSIRAVAYEARQAAQAEIWKNIEVGKRYTGVVKSMTSYGVFVDIGGVDGMVHISELSWSRIKNPAEVCSVGDTLEVYVISFDPEKRKISLGVKDRSTNPWDTFMSTYHVGDVAPVRIVKLMTFGAFAEVVPGVDGLIHISQIADRRIDKPGDVLSEGEIVNAKITAVDEEKQKISLSIRALLGRNSVEDEEANEDEE